MRGYRFLRDSRSLDRITDFTREITSHPLGIEQKKFSKLLFGEGVAHAETVCRQYLLIRVAGLNLNRALLYALGKPGSALVYYLPPEWRQIVRKHAFNVASLRMAMQWNAYVALLLAYGILTITKILGHGIKAAFIQSTVKLGRHVYFDSLAPGNLPQPCRDGRSHDIITWYMQWTGREPGIDTLCHRVTGSEPRVVNGIPVIAVSSPIPPLKACSLVRFTLWAIAACLIATLDLLRGRWWHALILNQAALAAQMRMQHTELLAQDYLFHNSGWIFRPLWTYEAQKRGARIFFYFYSINCEPFKLPQGYLPLPYGWQAMNWPHYLVWDEYQADFVRSAVGESAKISVVGQIWFSCSATEVPALSPKAVAVFDVTPFRSSRYRTLGLDFEYYLPGTCISFLHDVQHAAADAGYTMLWKRKRKIGSMAHPRYRYYSDQLSECGNVAIVDPDISANRVIESSKAVISMPFTSTALIARALGKPSCYYDPTGLVQKDDKASHGIEVITEPEELIAWLKGIPECPSENIQ